MTASRRFALSLLGFFALATLHTWPLSFAPGTLALHRNADTQVSEWLVSWMAHILPRAPWHLFDGNIFSPEPATLVYGDPVLVPGLLGAPLRWLGASPVLTFNLVMIVGLAVTAWAGSRLALRLLGTTDPAVAHGAALVGGALVAFNVHTLTRLPHLPATHLWGVPLALWLTDRLIAQRTRRDVLLLALIVGLTIATSLYAAALVMLAMAVTVVVGASGSWRDRLESGGAVVVAVSGGLVLALPVLWPYARFAMAGHDRPMSMVAEFSATPAGYLASTSVLDRGWTQPFFTTDVNALFPGVVALCLAAIGVACFWRGSAVDRRRALTLVILAIVGVVLSFGPATWIYRWAYDILPPLRGLRVAARFGYLPLVAIAMAAAAGVAGLAARARSPRARIAIVGVSLVLVTAEAWQGPVAAVPFTQVPPIYDLVASAPGNVQLAEVPFYPAEGIFQNGEYVLNATRHWRPLMNGYSGFTPDSYRRRAESFWFFPEDWAIDAMKREGVTHIMVHLERFGPEADGVVRALAGRADLELFASDALGHRLYRWR